MIWLRSVGSIKLQVFFAKDTYKRDYILQKRPIILSILLTAATPYVYVLTPSNATRRSTTYTHAQKWVQKSFIKHRISCIEYRVSSHHVMYVCSDTLKYEPSLHNVSLPRKSVSTIPASNTEFPA